MAQTWNALQQAQILSNQSPENSIGIMDCNGMPVESDESFAHEIEEFIEKENFSSMMDLQDISESDIKDLESGSLQHTCYESSWQDVMSSDDLEQDKPRDEGENNGNMIPCPLPNSVEVESILEAQSDKEILESAFETNTSLVEYSDISSCSDTEGNFDCNLSSSIDVNMGSNQTGQPSEEGDLNSSMHLSSAEVCHSIVEAGMSEINQPQDTGPPVTTGESNESVNHTGSDCSEGSLLTNAEVACTEVQGLDNMNGAVPLSKDGQIEEREITCDLECFLDHCKELGTSPDGSNCALNHVNIDTSLTSNGDENICPTIDSLSVCQLERTTPDDENTSSKPELEKTFVISGDGKRPLGDYQLDVMNTNPENTSSKPNFQETIKISGNGQDSLDGCQLESNQPGPKSPSSNPDFQETIGVSGHGKNSLDDCQLESNKPSPKSTSSKSVHGNSSQLEGQKFFTSDDEQVERSSFGFLESCFGLRSTAQNTEELKHLEPAHVNKVDECSLFNHTAFESKNKMDDGTDAPKDPPVLRTDQTSKTSLDPGQQKCLTGNGTITNKDSLSYLKTQKRKMQPVVLLKTTEKITCDGKKYHCFECQESTQSVDELIEHYHCMHSLHKSQYCLSCESYFTGGTLAGQHVCGKVELNDKKKSSPSYTKVLTGEKAKFICRYCSKSFVRQAYYEEHELKHRVVTHHRCDCCGLHFPNAHKCQSHKRKATCTPLILDPFLQTADHSESIHEKSDIPDVVETVGSNVEIRNCFVKLMDVCKTSQSPEQMHCQVCGKTFRLRAQLNAHLRSHSDEKPFKCDNCEKAFKYTWNLNKHKREQCFQKIVQHEKSLVPDSNFPPKFKCPICFRIFKYFYNRTRHLRHQCLKEYMKKGKGRIGDKYQCPLCKDMFTVAGNRNRHIKQTCIRLKLYRAKGKVKNRKELEELNNTKKEDEESLLTMSIPKASRYKCTFCPAEYSSKSGYYSHLAKHKLLGHDKKAVKHKHGNAVDLKNSSSAVEKPTSQESADKDARLSFSCRFCGRAFASPDSLKKHLRLHKGNKPFRCLDCGKNFARHGHLMAHKNVHRRNVQCSVCWEVLPSIGDLLKHRQSHPKKGMLKCPDCPLQFKFPVFLLRHVAVHERRRKLKELLPPKDQATPEGIYKEEFKCGLCQEAFVDSKAFSEHCLTHMPGPSASKCQFCKSHFSSRAGLVRHIRLHTGEKPFPCLTCGRHFHRKEVLKLHQEKCTVEQPPPLQTSSTKQIQAEHSVDASKKTNKVYNCSYCPHSFRFPNNLKLHERAHLAKTVLPCSKCGKFYRKRKFKDHVELCNGDKIKPACRKCGRIFTRKNYRNGHEKQCQGKQNKTESETETGKGTNEKGKFKQQCPQCFKCFRSSRFLQRHISLHSKETAYACMHCGQKFDSEDRYLQHEAFCDGVLKERRLESLRGSEKIKSMLAEVKNQKEVTVVPGENGETFKCKFCTKSFLRARYLRRHILTHTEAKPYRCKTCESCFSRYDHLKLHQARCRGKRQLEVRVEKMSLDSLSTSPQSKTQEDGDTLQCKVCSKQLSTPSDLKRHMSMLHITNKPFPCKRCGATYSSKKTLSRHNLTIRCKKISKESMLPAKNDVQTQPGREASKLLQRIQVHYMNKFKYQCEYCPRRFKLSGQLKVHVRLHTGEKPYGCANCGEHFIRTDYLKRHLAKCSGMGENQEKILCDKCGDLFTRDALSVHQKTCVISSKSSGSSQQVNDKDKSPTKIKGFSCANCSDRFLLFSQLQQHFLAKHRSDQPQNNNQQQLVSSHMQVIKQEQVDEGYGQNQESSSQINAQERRVCSNTDLIKPLKCPQCNMRFSRSTGLGMHMRIHKGVYPLSCTKCHVGFWTRKTMEKHRRKCTGHTLISNNGSAMESAGDLNDTVLVFNKGSNTTGTGVLQTKFSCKDQDQENDGEKGDVSFHKYQCSECDQSFTDGLKLISHLEEHGREDQERRSDIHRCHVCNKVFAQAGILQRHLKMQHNEKMNLTCEICFKSFRFPSDLDIHRSCHDPSRPFACNSCKMRFLTAKALTIHHRMAHLHAQPPNSKESSVKARTEQPEVYRCEPCDKTYMLKKSYMKHCKIKHKDDFSKTLVDNELRKSSGSASQESDEEDSRNFEDDGDNDSDSAPYFPCHVCGKTFLTSESLEDHQRCHLGEKPFECEECGKCFFQLANLQQHQRCHKSEFQCQMCGKGFVSLFSLRKHKQTHIRKRPHRCTKCHLSFTRSTELAEHMVTHRDENFPCDLCDETFSCKTSRAEHRKMHTEQEEELPPLIPPKPPQTKQVTPAITSNVEQYKYRCGICQVRFPDPEQLSEHGCNPAKERPYSCPECNKHFLHGSHLKKHQLSHQLTGPRSYQCNHCSMSFTHHHLFLSHLRSHGNEKSSKDTNFPTSEKMIRVEPVKRDKIYQCPICPESFYQALDLANHLSVHSHMCSVCNMTFPTKKDLDEHEQCHLTAATQYECTECGDSFLGSDAFRKHHCGNRNVTFSEKHRSEPSVSSSKKQSSGTRFQTGNDEEEEVDVGEDFIICPICKRRFSSNSSLMEHHKKHHEDPRPFKCLVCKKDFTKKRYLTQHQQIHSERPYQCEVCSESFKTEPALVSHRRMHDAKRQHQCPICSRTYLTANDLAKHKRKHAEHLSLSEDNREYRCDMCYKSFTMFAHLQKHQETHVGQVVYECTECDKAFAFLNLLEEHQRTHGAASTESLQSQSPTHFPHQSSVNE